MYYVIRALPNTAYFRQVLLAMRDEISPEKLADGHLLAGYVSDVSPKKVLEEGYGYELLGLLEEARTAYQSIPQDSEYRDLADLRLVVTDISQEKMSDAAQRGLALLAKNPSAKMVIEETALALHHAGRTREAYGLLMSHADRIDGELESIIAFVFLEARRDTGFHASAVTITTVQDFALVKHNGQ